jgi:peptidoglycan/xylan/chitin deacetylase (PgdA/CDA1 family)
VLSRRHLGTLLAFAALIAAILAATTHTAGARGTGADARPLFPRFTRAIPVLLYHRLTPSINGYGVAPADFAAQMQRLHDLGFQAISLEQYVRFVRGEPVDLPQRPMLITFDDGYISSYEVADPILGRYGWNATIYIPTSAIGTPGRLTWAQLGQMYASGRWQIDEHAGAGHVLVTASAAGRRLPFYASEIWANGKQESFDHYKERVSHDIQLGLTTLADNIPGWRSSGTFAVERLPDRTVAEQLPEVSILRDLHPGRRPLHDARPGLADQDPRARQLGLRRPRISPPDRRSPAHPRTLTLTGGRIDRLGNRDCRASVTSGRFQERSGELSGRSSSSAAFPTFAGARSIAHMGCTSVCRWGGARLSARKRG